MIRFACDSCFITKDPSETWILGLAAEAVSVTAARREITILPRWERQQAVDPLAVHFCSTRCKDNYIRQLFEEEPAPKLKLTTLRKKGKSARRRRKKAA